MEHVRLAKSLQIPQALHAPNGSVVRLAPGEATIIDEAPHGRLVADEDQPVARVGAGVIDRAGDDLARAVVAAHGVDGDRDAATVVRSDSGRRRGRPVERGDHLRRRCRSRPA